MWRCLAVVISLVLVLSRPRKPRAVIVIVSGVGVRNVARRQGPPSSDVLAEALRCPLLLEPLPPEGLSAARRVGLGCGEAIYTAKLGRRKGLRGGAASAQYRTGRSRPISGALGLPGGLYSAAGGSPSTIVVETAVVGRLRVVGSVRAAAEMRPHPEIVVIRARGTWA